MGSLGNLQPSLSMPKESYYGICKIHILAPCLNTLGLDGGIGMCIWLYDWPKNWKLKCRFQYISCENFVLISKFLFYFSEPEPVIQGIYCSNLYIYFYFTEWIEFFLNTRYPLLLIATLMQWWMFGAVINKVIDAYNHMTAIQVNYFSFDFDLGVCSSKEC